MTLILLRESPIVGYFTDLLLEGEKGFISFKEKEFGRITI